jgi:FMN phosphatase YigB (HAD superfamily)
MTTPEVLIFDLFGTLVFFDDARVPTMEVSGRTVPMTVTGLPQMLTELEPSITLETFLAELRRVGQAVIEEKRAAGIEIATPVRFERTLRTLGVAPAPAATVAVRMARLHMDTLARSVVCPAGRPELLARLGARHRLALLSNFDDGTTARRVIAEAGLTPYFDTIVISEEEGIRKPVTDIFERTCLKMGARPADCLYIGDTLVEDIHGARDAGLASVWIRREATNEESPALAVLPDVDALPDWLSARMRG